MGRKALPKPSAELLTACRLLGIKQEKRFVFNFHGHEISLAGCKITGATPLHNSVYVLRFIAKELANRLTEAHNGNIEALFRTEE